MITLNPPKQPQIQKQHRTFFIPYKNQRDHIGRVIGTKSQTKNAFNIINIFQNLKKSTREFYFDREFKKMESKFQRVKRQYERKEEEENEFLGRDVDKCMELADDLERVREVQQKNKENFYIDLHNKINSKISSIKTQLKKCKPKPQRPFRMEPFHISSFKQKSININLFRQMSTKSQMMATFCDRGLKYSGMVSEKKLHPWRKWYSTKQYELFPGKNIRAKQLQKSIYE